MPPDFDKSVLQVRVEDLGSKESAQAVLPQAFWLRWQQLHNKVCYSCRLPIQLSLVGQTIGILIVLPWYC